MVFKRLLFNYMNIVDNLLITPVWPPMFQIRISKKKEPLYLMFSPLSFQIALVPPFHLIIPYKSAGYVHGAEYRLLQSPRGLNGEQLRRRIFPKFT